MKSIVIIASVIYYSDNRFNYSNVRSVFTPEERLQQTQATIKSIQNYLPDSKILLVEGGSKNIVSQIGEDVEYKYLGNHWIYARLVNSKFKGLGETALMMYALWISKNRAFDFIFKISGRYQINHNFNLRLWDMTKFNFKVYGSSYSTRLYGFPGNYLRMLMRVLMITVPGLLRGKSIEEELFRWINSEAVCKIEALGVEGLVGNDGTTISE